MPPMEYFDPDNITMVDKHCKGCVHLAWMGGGFYWCDYIGDTGKPRPCPAGQGCTEKKVTRRKRVGIEVT